jgi:pyruvate dehydrogenase E1 component alpha subunit
VGETLPVAAGAAYWLRMNEAPDVVLCYFGDGASNQGTFHESLNMSALWKLPVVFICENNHYQIGTEIHRHSAVTEIFRRADAYGMDGERVDGMDVVAVYEATRKAIKHVREGHGPFLLECETYRYRGHSMADPAAYRSALEIEELRARDPLATFKQRGLDAGWFNETDCKTLETRAQATVDAASAFAKESPQPERLHDHVYAHPLDLYGGHP